MGFYDEGLYAYVYRSVVHMESGQVISIGSVSALKERGLMFSEISEIIISPRTLKHRKARREPLSHEETDRVVRVERILSLAEDVFASREKALTWLRMPDERLENRTPLNDGAESPHRPAVSNHSDWANTDLGAPAFHDR